MRLRYLTRSAVDERGVSAVEFALISPILALLLLGLLDFGIGFWEQMQVNNAARAGADFVQGKAYDSAKVETAVKNATYLSTISVSSNKTCGCGTSTGVTTGLTCGATCPSGSGTATGYVQVNTQASYSPIFAWPGLSLPLSLRSTAYAICQNTGCS